MGPRLLNSEQKILHCCYCYSYFKHQVVKHIELRFSILSNVLWKQNKLRYNPVWKTSKLKIAQLNYFELVKKPKGDEKIKQNNFRSWKKLLAYFLRALHFFRRLSLQQTDNNNKPIRQTAHTSNNSYEKSHHIDCFKHQHQHIHSS